MIEPKNKNSKMCWNKRAFRFYFGIMLSAFLLLGGCSLLSSKQVPSPSYQKDAVTLVFNASDQLNLYNGFSHETVICVYELSNPDIFRSMLERLEGVNQLLSCQNFDSSVKSRRRLVINPGEKKVVVLDRAEGARYLGVVVGYFKRVRGSFSRLVRFPVKKAGIIKRKRVLGEIHLDIELGPMGIIKP